MVLLKVCERREDTVSYLDDVRRAEGSGFRVLEILFGTLPRWADRCKVLVPGWSIHTSDFGPFIKSQLASRN